MFENKVLNNLDVIVYCGGKCGSSTLFHTFLNNGFKSYSTHSSKYFEHVCNKTNEDINKTFFDVIDFNLQQNKKIYIIDSYRNPIERKISSFFQNISLFLPNYNEKTMDEIISIFNTNFLYEIENYHSIDEVMLHYGLDIFTDFNFEKKYNIKEKDNLIFIKIRFNDINEWSEILSNIFNKKIEIYNHNLTTTKKINDLYIEFKKKYIIPENYLNYFTLNDITFNIYNTEDEKNKYINDWKNKLSHL
jgi:hypothetical protein